jgi:NAD(P)-dependent dehydrogenase (short-subunit alcohol dehydrogenase family)
MGAKKLAVVTGANRGIGYEIARQLAAEGVDVVATSRNPEEGAAAARELGVRHFALDVTRQESIDALAEHVGDGVDIVINNAGISMKGFDANVARGTLAVNFWGARSVTDRLLPLVRKEGRIVMVSSGMGELSSLSPPLRARFLDPSLSDDQLTELVESFVSDVAAGTHSEKGWPSSAYRVSKVALNALTRILARRLASDPRGILVNATCPGWVRTNMGGSSAPRSPEEGARTPVWLALLPRDGPSGGFFRDRRPIDW